jgi:clan AA aspartic protease
MKKMGQVYADIEIINMSDLELVRRGHMDQDEVRRMWIRPLVDSGFYYFCINEGIQEILELPVLRNERFQLADGRPVDCDVVGPVYLKFQNRRSTCSAVVLPEDMEPLLGMFPLEEMDVLIDSKRQELIVNPAHPDGPMHRL